MINRILIYVLAFLITLYCFFVYDDKVLVTMLVIESVYFVVSIVYVSSLRNKVKATMISHSLIAEKNKEVPITIRINNLSKMSSVHFNVLLRMENTITGERVKHKAHGVVDKESNKTMTIPIRIKECGNIKIVLEKIEIYDIFFVLKTVVKIMESGYIGVLPECHLIPVEVSKKTRDFLADAEEYSDRESGDDSSEIYQVREYRKEDSIHDIHWKLTAKMDELMVKENGKPLGAVVLIWLNLDRKNIVTKRRKSIFGKRATELNQRKILANMFEMVASISTSLLEEKCVHMVAWYESGNKIIHKKRISKEEHIYELLHRLLYVESYEESEEVKVQYEDAFRGVEFSTVVELRTDGKILVGEENIDVPARGDEVVWEQLYLKV